MDKEVLYRFFQGIATDGERSRIRKWMEASPEHARELMDERRLFDATLLLTDANRFHMKPGAGRKVRFAPWASELVRIASVVILTACLSFFYFNTRENKEIAMQELVVPAGQRIHLKLTDGTRVWLNSNSRIQYPPAFGKKTRNVVLDGEAYFEVAHNKKQPFVVHTPQGDIEVLGTTFNIEAYSGDRSFVTSLMEGSVKVRRGRQQLVLRPSQMAALQKDGSLKVSSIADYNVYRWREGIICFRNESFVNIMKKFEKYYDVEIRIETPKVQGHAYSGKFYQSDGILYALRVLQRDIDFKFVRDNEKHIIYIK